MSAIHFEPLQFAIHAYLPKTVCGAAFTLLALSLVGCKTGVGESASQWDWDIPFQVHAKPLPEESVDLDVLELSSDGLDLTAPNPIVQSETLSIDQSPLQTFPLQSNASSNFPPSGTINGKGILQAAIALQNTPEPDSELAPQLSSDESQDIAKILKRMLDAAEDDEDDQAPTSPSDAGKSQDPTDGSAKRRQAEEDSDPGPTDPETNNADTTDGGTADGGTEAPIGTSLQFRPLLLSLDDLMGMALASHPALMMQRAEVNAALGQQTQAGLPFNPTLQYQSEEIGNGEATGLHSLSVSQQFVTANKLSLAQSVQSQAVRKVRAQLRTSELQVRTEVEIEFAKTLIAQRRVQLTKQILVLAQNSVQAIESLLQAGEVSKVALLQAQVDFQRADMALEVAKTQLAANRRALAAVTAMEDLPNAELQGDLESDLQGKPWDQLLQQMLAINPELSEQNSELCRAQRALSLAHAQIVPNVTGQFGIGLDTVTDDMFASIGVSVPLPIRNRNQGNIRTAHAKIASASASIHAKQYDLATRLADAVSRYEAARQQVRRLETEIIPLAKQSLDLSLAAFNAGETSYLELLTAQRSLFTTRLNSLDALGQARRALAEINGGLVALR